MSRIRAIIFDIDDTLYPERDYVLSGYRAVADAFAGRLGEADAVHARMVALFDTPHRGRVFNTCSRTRRALPPTRRMHWSRR
jgi:putative hydrolase of the HAD superfamily